MEYHILNGDSLKEQFPKTIDGEIIVARECLCDGNVSGSDLNTLFDNRAMFLSEDYDVCTRQEYYDLSVSEFQKIITIPKDSEINLWFEEDVFCQVNFWFVVNLLHQNQQANLYLILPNKGNEYSFANLDKAMLQTVYNQKVKLKDISKISQLWEYYQQQNTVALLEIARELSSTYPFILKATEAIIENRPKESLVQIMNDLQTKNFGKVFQEFCKREAIYGYGDLQVKRLFDTILDF